MAYARWTARTHIRRVVHDVVEPLHVHLLLAWVEYIITTHHAREVMLFFWLDEFRARPRACSIVRDGARGMGILCRRR